MRILRWTGIIAGSLLTLVVVVLGVIYLLSQRRITKHYEVTGVAVPVAADSATIVRGEHIAITRACTGCHGPDLGGQVFIDVPPVARLYAANLTSGTGGIAPRYAASADWERSIRQGVAPDGRALLFMPAREFYNMSDADLGALIAWIKSRPPVDRPPRPQSVGPIGRALFLAGKIPLLNAELVDHNAPRPVSSVAGVTADYGHYLAGTCTGCHGDHFSGGPIPGAPPEMAHPMNISPDTVTGIGKWSQADFEKAIRHGIRPDGSQIKPDMPYAQFAHYSDDEVAALWMYLRTLPATPYGHR